MRIDNKNNRNRYLVLVLASVAGVLLSVSVYEQLTTASTMEPTSIIIDFNAYPENDSLKLDRGESLNTPILIESPAEAEYELKLSVMPDRSIGAITNQTAADVLTELISATVDKELVSLSPQDTSIVELGYGRVTRSSGSTLTISAAIDAVPGSYTYILEVRRQLPDGGALAAGKVFTVTVS